MSDKLISEPYRIFFPAGTLFLLMGALIWLPMLWNPSEYPVLLHRYLMLNGFTACFIAGFLMTAIPRFSQTKHAQSYEVLIFGCITFLGCLAAHYDKEKFVLVISALQPLTLLLFILPRISKRKENPPFSFIFIFTGLGLWLFSSAASLWIDSEILRMIHYEGAIASIILGVGSRLIPGILGHVEIVNDQRQLYEKPVALIKTIPLPFLFLVISFIASYLFPEIAGALIRTLVVAIIAFRYWLIYKAPVQKSALTRCIWLSSWLILLSFILKLVWWDGFIHASHSFFISGIVLLSLLVATRVLQSHGPKDKLLENKNVLYVVTGLIVIAAATRVSAYVLPESYLTHLGYSSIILSIAVVIWAWRYLRYASYQEK